MVVLGCVVMLLFVLIWMKWVRSDGFVVGYLVLSLFERFNVIIWVFFELYNLEENFLGGIVFMILFLIGLVVVVYL